MQPSEQSSSFQSAQAHFERQFSSDVGLGQDLFVHLLQVFKSSFGNEISHQDKQEVKKLTDKTSQWLSRTFLQAYEACLQRFSHLQLDPPRVVIQSHMHAMGLMEPSTHLVALRLPLLLEFVAGVYAKKPPEEQLSQKINLEKVITEEMVHYFQWQDPRRAVWVKTYLKGWHQMNDKEKQHAYDTDPLEIEAKWIAIQEALSSIEKELRILKKMQTPQSQQRQMYLQKAKQELQEELTKLTSQ